MEASVSATGVIGTHQDYLMHLAHLMAEREWHSLGRPYFKVHGQVAEWLASTQMNFSADHFSVPFDTFSVMLPESYGPAGNFIVYASKEMPDSAAQIRLYEKYANTDDPHGRAFCRGVANQIKEDSASADRLESQYGKGKLQLCFSWHDLDGGVVHAHIVVYEKTTLEEALALVDECDPGENLGISESLHWEHRRPMVRLAIGVAMFAVNKHELVAPDVNIEQLRSRFPGGRSRGSQLLAQQAIARELKKCRGWTIGQEINLPRPEYLRRDDAHGEGASLEFSHVRSGHMRMQPHGPANSLRKLIFVAPTVVRKDLPMQPHRGFQLRDNIAPATIT